MAATHVVITPTTTVGKQVMRVAELLAEVRGLLTKVHGAANAATDAGTNTDALIGAPFGAADSANAAKYWTALNALKTLLDGDDAGGLNLYTTSLYNGESE